MRATARAGRQRESPAPFAVHPDQPELEGSVAGGEPGQAHAQLPDRLRREHRGAGVDLLLVAADGGPQRRLER